MITLKDLTSVGPAMLRDFALLGITTVEQLRDKEAVVLYEALCKKTGTRHNTCFKSLE